MALLQKLIKGIAEGLDNKSLRRIWIGHYKSILKERDELNFIRNGIDHELS